jgi:integrase/recombinase XerD
MHVVKNKKIKFYNKYLEKIESSDFFVPRFYFDNMQSFIEINDYFIEKIFLSRSWQSEKTISINAQHLEFFFCYIEDNNLNWKNINKNILSQWRDNIKKQGISGKELSNKTVNASLQSVISFYNYCYINNIVKSNPFQFTSFSCKNNLSFNQKNLINKSRRAVVKLSENFNSIEIPTQDELGLFFLQKTNKETEIMSRLMYECGLRREEVYTINKEAFEDIKCSDEQFFYYFYLDNDFMTTKGKKNRKTIISKSLLNEIKKYINGVNRDKRVDKFEKKYKIKTNKVFISRLGNQFSGVSLNKAFEKICLLSGFSKNKITPHILRHCFATHNLVYNLDKFNGSEEKMIHWLSKCMGHASPSITRDNYIHLANELSLKLNTMTEFEKKTNSFFKEVEDV